MKFYNKIRETTSAYHIISERSRVAKTRKKAFHCTLGYKHEFWYTGTWGHYGHF